MNKAMILIGALLWVHPAAAEQPPLSPAGVKTLAPDGAIKPTGTWSLGTRAGDFIFIAGMRGIDAKTDLQVQGDEARIRQAFLNMKLIADSEGRNATGCGSPRRLCHGHVSLPSAGEQDPAGAVGRRSLSAAHHHRSPSVERGRYLRGRRHLLCAGQEIAGRFEKLRSTRQAALDATRCMAAMAFAKRSTDPADPAFRSLAKPFLCLREHPPGGFHPCERAPGFVVSGLSSQKRAVVGVCTIFGS